MLKLSNSWRPLLAAASVAVLAACSSSHPMQQSEAAPMSPAPATMSQTPAGNVMTTPTGMTLYTFDKDAAGKSNCNGECAQYWPPLIAKSGSAPTGNLTLITRDDGQMQWATANGMPLYTYEGDKAVGEVKGNNFHGIWHVAI